MLTAISIPFFGNPTSRCLLAGIRKTLLKFGCFLGRRRGNPRIACAI
jgi:hypothetical protein